MSTGGMGMAIAKMLLVVASTEAAPLSDIDLQPAAPTSEPESASSPVASTVLLLSMEAASGRAELPALPPAPLASAGAPAAPPPPATWLSSLQPTVASAQQEKHTSLRANSVTAKS